MPTFGRSHPYLHVGLLWLLYHIEANHIWKRPLNVLSKTHITSTRTKTGKPRSISQGCANSTRLYDGTL